MNLFLGLSGSRLFPASVVLSTEELRLSSWAELFSPSIELFIEVSAYSDLQIIRHAHDMTIYVFENEKITPADISGFLLLLNSRTYPLNSRILFSELKNPPNNLLVMSKKTVI